MGVAPDDNSPNEIKEVVADAYYITMCWIKVAVDALILNHIQGVTIDNCRTWDLDRGAKISFLLVSNWRHFTHSQQR